MAAAKILYLVSEDWYFCSHRLPMARAARDAGYEVVVLTRLNEHVEPIAREGFRPLPLRLKRGSLNPFGSAATVLDIARTYRRERPDLVHHVNLKMCLLGSAAARLAGVPRIVNALTGLGFVFTAEGLRAGVLRVLVLTALRTLSSRPSVRVVVQNRDDYEMVVTRRIAGSDRVAIVPGSGVDVRRFCVRPEPDGPPTVTFVGRMLHDKGIREIVDAARLLRRRGRTVRFVLVGPTDPENPQSIAAETLARWTADGLVDWVGYREDIPAVWADATLAVLPSYREGMPMSLLEAAASGRPLIATDVPGCRDLVRHGETGLLVRPRDPTALADAIERLIDAPELRHALGRAARARAESGFSDAVVADATVRLYRSLLTEGRGRPRSPPH